MEQTPQWYFSSHFRNPDFGWKILGFGVYIGREKSVNPKYIVWNVYTPWFSFGYAW